MNIIHISVTAACDTFIVILEVIVFIFYTNYKHFCSLKKENIETCEILYIKHIFIEPFTF